MQKSDVKSTAVENIQTPVTELPAVTENLSQMRTPGFSSSVLPLSDSYNSYDSYERNPHSTELSFRSGQHNSNVNNDNSFFTNFASHIHDANLHYYNDSSSISVPTSTYQHL